MYKIAICDDDEKYVEYLEKLIDISWKDEENCIIEKYYSGEAFLEKSSGEYDLIILDMQMGKIDGITVAINLRKQYQETVIVFCTGVQLPKPEFFDVQPFRYLMKSYTEEKLGEEIKIILDKMRECKKKSFFIAFSDGKMNKVLINDITYISNLKRGCCIHTFIKKSNQCKEIISNKKLSETYEQLRDSYFEYAHNSYIVNFNAIISVRNDVLTLEDLTTLNISRSKKAVFHKRFAEYLGGKYKRNR